MTRESQFCEIAVTPMPCLHKQLKLFSITKDEVYSTIFI